MRTWVMMGGCLLYSAAGSGAAVIFDLGGVLFIYRKQDVHAAMRGTRKTSPFKPIDAGIALVRRCRAQIDAHGVRKHRLYILSNFAHDSFTILQRFHQPILDLFDGIVLSCRVGYAKPDRRIYEHLLRLYQLKPAECIFIDDELPKARAATAVGMHGIVCRNHSRVANELRRLQIF